MIESLHVLLKFRRELSNSTLDFVYLGLGEFFSIAICTLGFAYVGDRITQRVRERYLKAALSQNIGFFNDFGSGELTTRITNDTNLIQEAISIKVSNTITAVGTFIASFIVVLIVAWKLGLVSLSAVVAMTLIMGGMSRFMLKYTRRSLQSFALGGTIAEESISAIRVTMAFGAQMQLADRYKVHIDAARQVGTMAKTFLGISIAGMACIIMMNYGLNFWVGSIFLVQGQVNVNQIVTVIYATIIGAFSLGFLAPNLQAFSSGVAAANKVFSVIDRQSPLDPFSSNGEQSSEKPNQWDVHFRNVRLVYPARPDVAVLDGLYLHIPAGKTTALVGPSGSGKSSIVNILERFYPPVTGEVFIGDQDIQTMNLRWLRQQISLVDQEPVLFNTTIEDNIMYGLIGSRFETLTKQEKTSLMMAASETANAHDFIKLLPKGYQTPVGERGSLLSGGQKQRIAIARAMIRDPKILILDEATSALDTSSESLVQDALSKAAQGRTTIVIAHRLSTIRDADNIVVMSNGKIVEQGNHKVLLSKRSSYFSLVEAQQFHQDLDDKESSSPPPEYRDPEKPSPDIHETTAFTSGPGFESRIILYGESDAELSATKTRGVGELIKFIISYNRQDKWWMILGFIMSVFGGSGTPTSAVFFAECIRAMSKPPRLYDEVRRDVNFWATMYLWLGIFLLIVNYWRDRAFAKCSERLIFRVRDQAFRSILRQDISFFESKTTGALISFLATETTNISGLSGPVLGTILSMSTCIIAAIILSIVFSWKLGLVCTAIVPLLLASGFLRFYMLSYAETKSKTAYNQSANYACEAISAIRTVASLGREESILREYSRQLKLQSRKALKTTAYSAVLYAASQALPFFCIALGFWYGGTLISKREISLFQFFVCFTEIIFSAQTAGYMFANTPDVAKARTAASSLKDLCERRPMIDTWSTEGSSVPNVSGKIEFDNVSFRYPTSRQAVLRNISFKALPGQYIALVGASGSGKSTCIGLLERFYNSTSGRVLIDGEDITALNVNQYRSHVALVSQEPALYHGTIKENILLGASADVPMDFLHQACHDANIYDFIMSLPYVHLFVRGNSTLTLSSRDGFETMVGAKGVLLSGGQKQRISIARALVRNPSIL